MHRGAADTQAMEERALASAAPAALRRAMVATLAAAALLPAGTASAATLQEAQQAAAAVKAAEAVPVGWTGSITTCTPGTESQASLDATLRALNTVRSIGGLPAVTLDAALSQRALETTMMELAAYQAGKTPPLRHDPPADWPCYTADRAAGAAASNLALGATGASAVALYLADEGVTSLGHRRWLLDPALQAVGTGSTDTTNALTVIGGPRSTVAAGRIVPWPAAGSFPATWIPSEWSVSVGGTGENVVVAAPQVTMTLDGKSVPVSAITDLGTGYGTGRAVSWVPALNRTALATGYHELRAVVTGFSINGAPVNVDTTTTLGQQLPPLKPTISTPKRKKAAPGTRLTATFARGTGRVVSGYRWLRDGKVIAGAKRVVYTVGKKDAGHKLQVEVSSQAKDGGSVGVELSAAVKVARR